MNEKLSAAKTAADGGDFDTAIAQLTEATQMDPTRDVVWGKLGEYELASAPKQTDSAEKTKRYEATVADFQKAVELKQKAMDAVRRSLRTPSSSWPRTTTTWARQKPNWARPTTRSRLTTRQRS